MASSRPAPFVIGDDEDWGNLSPLPTSTSRGSSLPSSSTASGEFLTYVNVGAALTGGGAKRSVWVLEDGTSVCLGKVGINNKFCVKLCGVDDPHCGTARHSAKFAVGQNVAYIRFSDTQVHCTPVLPLDGFNQSQREKLLESTFTAAEWEAIFGSVQSGHLPEWLEELKLKEMEVRSEEDDEHKPLQLLSPLASRDKHGVFDILPSFSFDSAGSSGKDEEGGDKNDGEDEKWDDTMGRLTKVETRLDSLKMKLTRPFLDIDASYSVLSADLSKVYDRVKSLTVAIGPIQRYEATASTINILSSKVKGLEEFKSDILTRYNRIMSTLEECKDNLNATMEDLAEQQSNSSFLENWRVNTDRTLATFDKRFASIKAFIQRTNLNDQFNPSESAMPPPSKATTAVVIQDTNTETIARKIADMEEKIKILENRVVGAGVQMGSFVFQSFDDLVKWVQVKIPKGRFGLFVDGHSFLEFFTLSGHVDTEAGTAAFSHSIKAGFTTYVEAQLAMSFKNLFPAVLGKGGSASMDDSECLPAIANGDKWNNGSTGIHYQLMRNMNDVSYQLDSSIKKVLKDHPEGRQLAIDCVTASKRFVIDLIAFMSQEYATWQQRGFSKKDAWRIVCQIVRRIFEDMQSARISARNSQDLEDADFTTASFLYATLRCHGVMEGYVRHQFHAHPHVASVITRHLAANFVKPEDTKDSKFAALEAKVMALSSTIDSTTSKVNLMVTKEKEKHKANKEKTKADKLKKSLAKTGDDSS
jgi:uncharacterized protein YoxC